MRRRSGHLTFVTQECDLSIQLTTKGQEALFLYKMPFKTCDAIRGALYT